MEEIHVPRKPNENDSDYYVRVAIANGDTELARAIYSQPNMQPTANSEASASIADNIRDLRRRAGLTQQELAQAIGIAQSNLARLEAGKGNPTLKTLQSIATALSAELAMRPRS